MNKYANIYLSKIALSVGGYRLPSMEAVKATAKGVASKATEAVKNFRPADMSNTLPAGIGLGALIGGAKGLVEDPGYDEMGNRKSRIKSMLKQMAIGGAVGGAAGAAAPLVAQQIPTVVGAGKKTINSYLPAEPMLGSQGLGNLMRNAPMIGSDTRFNAGVDSAVAAQKANLANVTIADLLRKLK